jgi:hypothetical protein
MRLPATLLVLLLLTAPLAGCLGGDDGECSDGSGRLKFVEVVSDPDTITVANVRFGDLDGDGSEELFATHPIDSEIAHVDCSSGTCVEERFSEGLHAPVRTHVADLDGDGVNELVVADIGILFPTPDLVGRVVILSFDANGGYTSEVILEGVGRVACAEAADLDGDGDLDIVVCIFGDTEGSVVWLENSGNGSWLSHQLDHRSGAIHAFPFDADGDGDLDIAVSLSQLSEEVLIFRNDGLGYFQKHVLASSNDTSFGMSGISISDLDQDGDFDILYTNGDTLDMDTEEGFDPHAVHGAAWLENDGFGGFTEHELTRVWGAYANTPFDYDSDGDLDIIVGTFQLDMVYSPITYMHIDMVLLINDGNQNFTRQDITDGMRYMLTMDVGDFDGDGEDDLVGGSHRLGFPGDAHRMIELSWGVDGQACP